MEMRLSRQVRSSCARNEGGPYNIVIAGKQPLSCSEAMRQFCCGECEITVLSAKFMSSTCIDASRCASSDFY